MDTDDLERIDLPDLSAGYALRLLMQNILCETSNRLDKAGNTDLGHEVFLINSFWTNDEFVKIQMEVICAAIKELHGKSLNSHEVSNLKIFNPLR
jgi:hypothetical protein